MRRTFKDPELQETFERMGFVSIPALATEELEKLRTLSDAYPTEGTFGMNFFLRDAKKRFELSREIIRVVRPRINSYLLNYRPLHASFFTKHQDAESALEPHMDPTIVDEDRYPSVVVWLPLSDVDKENGCLWLVPGSHLYMPRLRPFPVECLFEYVQRVWDGIPHDLKQPVPIGAGSALMFHPALIHWSGANRSKTTRIAIQHYAVPHESEVLYCRLREDGRIARYRADDEFMLTALPGFEDDPNSLIDVVDPKK